MRAAATAVITTVLMLAAAAGASAADWYVDHSDSGTTCTQADPCKTINAAIFKAGNDDVIHVAGGGYSENVDTPKRLTFDGAGMNPFGGGTVLSGTTAGPAMRLTGGGTVRDMAVLAADPGTASEAEDAISLAASGAGAPVHYTIANSFARAGNVPTNNDPGHALYTTGTGSRAIDLRVSDSTLSGRSGGGSGNDAVTLATSTASSTYALTRVDVAANSEATGIDAGSGTLTLVDSSVEQGANDALFLGFGAVANIVRSQISGDRRGVLMFSGTTLTARDSLIRADSAGAGPEGILLEPTASTATSVDAVHSTIVARGPSPASALHVHGGSGAVTVHARNSAFHAVASSGSAGPDVLLEKGSGAIVFDPSHSYYGTAMGVGMPVPAPGSGTNVAGNPGFRDPAAADYSLLPNSPLVDRGASSAVVPGERDLAGAPRSRDGNGDCVAVPDIGAYERPSVTPCHPKTVPDTTAPEITRVRFKPHKLRVRRRGKLTLRLSEKATLTAVVQRRRHGKWRAFAKIVRKAAGPGPVKLRIGPKVKGKRLKRGRYRIRLRAVDAAGNRSKTSRVGFIVVRARGHR
jgi:hypothetical protein